MKQKKVRQREPRIVDVRRKKVIVTKEIQCKTCGKLELVNQNSLCDILQLCIEHARAAWTSRQTYSRPSALGVTIE